MADSTADTYAKSYVCDVALGPASSRQVSANLHYTEAATAYAMAKS